MDIQNSGTKLLIIARGNSPCDTDTAILSLIIQRLPIVQVDADAFICEGNAYDINSATAKSNNSFKVLRVFMSNCLKNNLIKFYYILI